MGIAGREEILWTGGGLADSSSWVRGKALWGNFEAEYNNKCSNLVIWYNTITQFTKCKIVKMNHCTNLQKFNWKYLNFKVCLG